MAYTGGLYTGGSQAAAAEAKRFRDFQTDIDAMSARERAGLYRRDQAAMDQFTAGLKPQSNIATPDWTMPAAPPAPASSTGGVGAPGTPGYERNRLMQDRKLLEDQFNSEVAAQKTLLDDLGRQKYILEQQLTVAPAYQQQAIRDNLTVLNREIEKTVTGTRARVKEFGTLFEKIDTAIRQTDKGQAIMSGSTPAAPGGYTPGALPDEGTAAPDGLGAKPTTIPVPDSLGFPEEAAPPAAAPGAAAAPPAVMNPEGQAYIASLTAAQFAALPKEEQDKILAAVNRERQANRDRANFLTIPAAASDLAARPINALTYIFNWASEASDLPRYARAIGLGDVTSIQVPYLGADPTQTSTPYSDLVYKLREASTPLTREQFIANLKANEQQQQSAAPGKTDLPAAPAAGMSPPVTPEGAAAVAAGPALQQAGDVPIGDPTNPRVAAITKYSSESVAARIKDLPPIVGKAVTSDQGQAIIKRAREIGVDPAAAMAIYGIESTFGTNKGQSGKGAVGPLQVSAGEWSKFQQWFLNPANQSTYKFGPELAEIAANAIASSIDAGLLRLKYNELVGVEKNLWGAAYQSSAEAVKKAGRPLARHDAPDGKVEGLTNSDYNKLYVELYNEARQYVNIPPSTTTSQEGIVGNSQVIRELDAAEEQLRSDYAYNMGLFDEENARNEAKRQEVIRRMKIAQQFSDVTAYEAARTELDTLDTLTRDNGTKIREVETAARLKMDEINLKRTGEYIRMAELELDGGNPEPLADMLTRGTGMLTEIRKVGTEPPTYAVFQNNQLVSGKGYTVQELKDKYLSLISESHAARVAAQQEADLEWRRERLREELKLVDSITLEQAKATLQQEGWTEGKDAVTDPNTGEIIEQRFFRKDPSGKLRVIRLRTPPTRDEGGLPVQGKVEIDELTAAGMKQ